MLEQFCEYVLTIHVNKENPMKMQTFGLSAVILAGTVGGCVGASASLLRTAYARETAPPQSMTVFVDATFGFRKDHLARQLTKSQAEFAAKGYRFADMQAYTENGDLQGVFVTYTHDN